MNRLPVGAGLPAFTAKGPLCCEAVAAGTHGLGRPGGVFVLHPSIRIPGPPLPIRPVDAAAPLTWIETEPR